MTSQPCDLVTLEPTRVVETLKNLTTRFRDYRVVDVVNLLPTANDGTIMHLYMQVIAEPVRCDHWQCEKQARPAQMSTLNADDAGGSGFNAMRPGILYAYARNPYFFLSLLQSSKVNKTKEKTGDEKYSCHSLDEVSRMIHNTLSAYESKVHNMFLDLGESNILRPYMSDAIIDISKVCEVFEAKEAAPSVAGYLEQIGSKIGQNILYKEYSSFQNGYPVDDLEESLSDPLPGMLNSLDLTGPISPSSSSLIQSVINPVIFGLVASDEERWLPDKS
uniref:Exocyst complex component SEC5 n=1 Tax=Lactuca sativa TaxID=4236 RepID=A0A9R1VK85_LACSA|nr:hypothetical protein LSAT_V11C500245270 [Lactuca sativa]